MRTQAFRTRGQSAKRPHKRAWTASESGAASGVVRPLLSILDTRSISVAISMRSSRDNHAPRSADRVKSKTQIKGAPFAARTRLAFTHGYGDFVWGRV